MIYHLHTVLVLRPKKGPEPSNEDPEETVINDPAESTDKDSVATSSLDSVETFSETSAESDRICSHTQPCVDLMLKMDAHMESTRSSPRDTTAAYDCNSYDGRLYHRDLEKVGTITSGTPREPLPFHSMDFPADEKRDTTPPSAEMSSVRPPAALLSCAKNDYLSQLPPELKISIMERLKFDECAVLAATSWRMRLLEQGTLKLTWRRQQAAEFCRTIQGNSLFYGYHACHGGCGKLMREDCFLAMATWHEEQLLRKTWGCDISVKTHSTCVDCMQRAGTLDGLFREQVEELRARLRAEFDGRPVQRDNSGVVVPYEDGEQPEMPVLAEDGFIRRRCSCCQRAKVVRLRHWCEDCHTCRACRKDWKLQYDGFCQTCASWRGEAVRAYQMTTFPSTQLPLDNEAWFRDVDFKRSAEEGSRIIAKEMREFQDQSEGQQ